MKDIHYKIALAAIIVLTSVTSCKKSFLEVVPKSKIIAKTTTDYGLLLANLNFYNIPNANAQVFMGDEVAAVDPYFTAANFKNQSSFRWNADIYLPTEDGGEILSLMQNIYQYNKVINEVPNSTGGTDSQKQEIVAEAMAGRAWTYFLLINYYGKPYHSATAANDPGFPIVTAADVTATTFTRASVQGVYDFIIKDLTTAIPSLPPRITYRTQMSRAAAEAILGKVYMWMGNFNDALPQLDAAFNDMANSVIPVRLYDYNVELAPGGAFLPNSTTVGPQVANLPDYVENLLARQFFPSNQSELVIPKSTIDLYTPSDLRLKFFSNTLNFSSTSYAFSNILRRWGSNNAVYFGMQVPDLYLLRAETKCRLDDLNGAKTDVEALRKTRMSSTDYPVPSAIVGRQLPLLKFILDERIREFAMRGYRWFDMRRLSVDSLFSPITFSHTLYAANGDIITTFQLKEERLTLRFPIKVIDQNPGLVQNP